jgi:uncharacterized membrane protein YoaK (UPF0700 family)
MPGKNEGLDSKRAATRRDRVLLALAFTAGCVDALSYLGLSRVFTANMTGNAVLLGLAIGQTQELQVAHSSAAIVGFVLGVIVAARLVGPPRERVVWSPRITLALRVECAVLVVFALAWWLSLPSFAGHALMGLIVLSGVAMGIQSAVARRLAVPGVTTTYITGTITALVAELTAVSGARGERRRMTAVIVALVAGAVTGGVVQAHAHPAAGLVPAVVVATVLVAIACFGRATSGEAR